MLHPTAIVEAGAQLGADVVIWQWVHVMPGARVGDRTSIGQGCFIGPVAIGPGCRIQNHVSLYEGVTLEADVFLGPSCVFTNVRHPRAHVSRKDEYAPTVIGRGATLGANATILCGVTIGEYAMIGAGAVVTKDVWSYEIAVGVPAKPLRRRFPDEVCDGLQELAWWDWEHGRLARVVDDMRAMTVEDFLAKYESP